MLFLFFVPFFINDTSTTEIYTYCHTLSLHDALPISDPGHLRNRQLVGTAYRGDPGTRPALEDAGDPGVLHRLHRSVPFGAADHHPVHGGHHDADRKSTRQNSSH